MSVAALAAASACLLWQGRRPPRFPVPPATTVGRPNG